MILQAYPKAGREEKSATVTTEAVGGSASSGVHRDQAYGCKTVFHNSLGPMSDVAAVSVESMIESGRFLSEVRKHRLYLPSRVRPSHQNRSVNIRMTDALSNVCK